VYDNASEPKHIAAVRPWADNVQCLSSNRHFTPVCNLAAKRFRAFSLLCFVTNDTILADTAIERLVREARKLNVGWVSAAYQQGNCWGHCVTPFPKDVLAQLPKETRKFDAWARSLTPSIKSWNRTETTVFMIPTRYFLGFDEVLDSGRHEVDYGIRLVNFGWKKMLVAYDAVIWHQLGSPTAQACIADGSRTYTPLEVLDAYLLKKWGPERRCWWENPVWQR
jgi:GT2 family glycosyltransferase